MGLITGKIRERIETYGSRLVTSPSEKLLLKKSQFLPIIISIKKIPVYSLNAIPGPVLPALPARCLACACEIGVTTSESMPNFGSYLDTMD